MIKIKVVTGDPTSACSYYRSMGVLSYLRRLDKNIQVDLFDRGGWGHLAGYDILFLERPANADYVTLAQIAKDMGLKVWSDWDDNFFEIPKYNPNYKWARLQDIKESIHKCIHLSDAVTVSTENLGKYYDKDPIVIPNALNDYIHTLPEEPSDKKVVLWRGSATHSGDLAHVIPDIESLSKKYGKEWKWVFIGNDLWYAEDRVSNVRIIEEMGPPQYFKTISENGASILISPLDDNEFNRGKSNIAWIEATMAGAVCIAPPLPEFEYAINYGKGVFFLKVEDAMIDEKIRKENFFLSRQHIMSNLLLSQVNKKRLEIIYKLIGE